MTDFDKKIQELSKEVKTPEEYNRRVEQVLQTIPQMSDESSERTEERIEKLYVY